MLIGALSFEKFSVGILFVVLEILLRILAHLPLTFSSCLAWTRSLLSTVLTSISSGQYWDTSNRSFSSFSALPARKRSFSRGESNPYTDMWLID